MRIIPTIAYLLATLALAPAHAAKPASTTATAASVNGVAIPASALNDALRQASGGGLADTPALRQSLKSQLIARELLRQEAEKRGLAKDREVEAATADARGNAMIQKFLREAIKPRPVSEEQVRRRYDEIVASLGPHEYKPRIVQTRDEPSAKRVLDELKAGKSFEELARTYSLAPSAHHGGLLDWVSFKVPLKEGATQGVPLPIAEVLTQLMPGMVAAEPIVWNNVRYVVRLDDVRPTQIPAYEHVKPTLRELLERQEVERASAALVAELIKNAKIRQ